MLSVTLMLNKLLECFTIKNYKNDVEENSGKKKVIERKGDKLYVKCKSYDNFFNNWINKNILWYKMGIFPGPCTCSKSKIKVVKDELDLSNYAAKSDLKTQQVFIH